MTALVRLLAAMSRALACLLCAGVMPMAWAQPAEPFCTLFENRNNGDYLYQETNGFTQAASRRRLDEPNSLSASAVKGALARRLSSDAGGQSVRWSGAQVRGPLACSGFKVLVVMVDLRTVQFTPAEASPAELREDLVEAAMVRQLAGRATREDLGMLRDFYARHGDLPSARKMAEEMLTTNLK